MDQPADQRRQRLIQALCKSDSLRRNARADRIEWLSLHTNRPSFIAGRAETLQLLQEAHDTFVDGHFAGTLMIAMAVIEHCVVEHLQLRRLTQGSPTFAQAVRLATETKLFPPDWLARATRLSHRRNPFAHLKDENHPHSLGARVQSEDRHPRAIMEEDAKDALELMSNIFIATLREWPLD
ncbi:hypothetical protein [Aromatoleum diolicum]|uniref:DUF4145 domain-containing protein n=1 Tax=Aromatoleum diolicum TaxID=75796 RepID=A0ABX1Q5S7_9RHOO|nr:hypothetical protein [Aromatoleum diolicum]NMG73714.1 hypothetical protein [Aromatoleum diolicum]